MNHSIQRANLDDANDIAIMVGELLNEIMTVIGVQAFNFDLIQTTGQLKRFLEEGKYFSFIARELNGEAIGFVNAYESYALYAEGAFGTIPEFYVRLDYRSSGVGANLAKKVKAFGNEKGWKRLEVTTPPLPQFEKTLAFYEREGFTITGGRKLKVNL
jgi:GNAT superfamily N-acetyltransferase